MNVDDLRQTLQTVASEADASPSTPLLQAVDAKVRSARRRRIGTGLGVVALAAALGLVIPHLFAGADSPGADDTAHRPSVVVDTSLPTVEDQGVAFYTSPAGNTLLGEKMGVPGQSAVVLTVTPDTTDLTFQSVCLSTGVDPGAMEQRITINGRSIVDRSCDNVDQPVSVGTRFGYSPHGNAQHWRGDIGVVPGRPVTLRVSLVPGAPVGTSPIQLGIALYAMTGTMLHDHGVWFGKQTVFDGHTYELVDDAFRRFHTRTGALGLPLPSSDRRPYLEYGAVDVHSSYQLTADSSGSSIQGGGGSSLGGLARPGQRVATLSISIDGHVRGALLYILEYRPID